MLWFKKTESKPYVCPKCHNEAEEVSFYGMCSQCLANIRSKQWEAERKASEQKRIRQQRLDSLIEQIPKLISLLEDK